LPPKRPLAAQYGTTIARRLFLIESSIEIKPSILRHVEAATIDQRSINDALEMEHDMFKDMLAAGMTRHGWLLAPIVADLVERNERLQRQQKRLTYWL
jgi:hypothetical protein